MLVYNNYAFEWCEYKRLIETVLMDVDKSALPSPKSIYGKKVSVTLLTAFAQRFHLLASGAGNTKRAHGRIKGAVAFRARNTA